MKVQLNLVQITAVVQGGRKNQSRAIQHGNKREVLEIGSKKERKKACKQYILLRPRNTHFASEVLLPDVHKIVSIPAYRVT